MKKILIAGSLNMDLVLRVPRFPNPGETVLGISVVEHIGGKGCNQASACALQKAPTTMWGCVGNDAYGKTITEGLKNLAIHTEISKEVVSTGLALIEVSEEGQNRIVVIPGANACFSQEYASLGKNLLDTHDILLLQNEIPLKVNCFLAQEAKKRGKIVLFNPAPASPLADSELAFFDYLLPNEHELGIISGMQTKNTSQIKDAMVSLKKRGANCIITTMGDQGVLCLEETFLHIPSLKVKLADTTGAGDAFAGSFAAYLSKGLPLEECLLRAVCAASISVTRFGAFASAGSEKEVSEVRLHLNK